MKYLKIITLISSLLAIGLSCNTKSPTDNTKSPTDTPASGYFIYGLIVDMENNGVEGVSVSTLDFSVKSDSIGFYCFHDLTNGMYTLKYFLEGYTFSPAVIDLELKDSSLTVDTVIASLVPPSYEITGRITGEEIICFDEVLVELTGENYSLSTKTDSTGYYRFSAVPNGIYTIIPSKTGCSFSPPELTLAIEDSTVSVPVITAALKQFRVKGGVETNYGGGETGGNIYLVNVHITGEDIDKIYYTNIHGDYQFLGLYSKEYTLSFSKENYTFEPSSLTITVTEDMQVIDRVKMTKIYTTKDLTMVDIPSGSFTMGDELGDLSYFCRPTHTVSLSDFKISAYEVTVSQYTRYLNVALKSGEIKATSVSVTGAAGELKGKEYVDIDNTRCLIKFIDIEFVGRPEYEEIPVVEVTWYGAKAFAQFYGMDLPTEAEWEYACRGGNDYLYGTADGTIDYTKAWYERNSKANVGLFAPNPYGLYDMSGNVSEWCNDWADFYGDITMQNPTGPESGYEKIIRGGSWHNRVNACRSACRDVESPDNCAYDIGFRVVQR